MLSGKHPNWTLHDSPPLSTTPIRQVLFPWYIAKTGTLYAKTDTGKTEEN
jgi:hypothetical protein